MPTTVNPFAGRWELYLAPHGTARPSPTSGLPAAWQKIGGGVIPQSGIELRPTFSVTDEEPPVGDTWPEYGYVDVQGLEIGLTMRNFDDKAYAKAANDISATTTVAATAAAEGYRLYSGDRGAALRYQALVVLGQRRMDDGSAGRGLGLWAPRVAQIGDLGYTGSRRAPEIALSYRVYRHPTLDAAWEWWQVDPATGTLGPVVRITTPDQQVLAGGATLTVTAVTEPASATVSWTATVDGTVTNTILSSTTVKAPTVTLPSASTTADKTVSLSCIASLTGSEVKRAATLTVYVQST